MKRLLALVALVPSLAAAPLSLTATYLDIAVGGQSYALAADATGNLFTVSTAYEPSGRQVIRIIKTDPSGNVLAQLDFGAQASAVLDTDYPVSFLQPIAAATDAQGNLIVVGNANGATVPLVPALMSNTTPQAAFVAKFDPQLQGHPLFDEAGR
jgi:hypothetical protein